MQDLEMIAALSNAFGPSGFEDYAVAVARSKAPEGYTIEEDSLRNLYIRRAEEDADKPVVMLDAHSDEVASGSTTGVLFLIASRICEGLMSS